MDPVNFREVSSSSAFEERCRKVLDVTKGHADENQVSSVVETLLKQMLMIKMIIDDPRLHSAAWQPGRFSGQLHLHTHLSATLSHTYLSHT